MAADNLLPTATRIYNENFRILELLVVASLWYLLMTTIASIGQYYIELRFSRGFAQHGRPGLARFIRESVFLFGRREKPEELANDGR